MREFCKRLISFAATVVVLFPTIASGTDWSWDGHNELLTQEVEARVQDWDLRKGARSSVGAKKSSEVLEVNESLIVDDRTEATAPQLILNPDVVREGKASRADRSLGNTRADHGSAPAFEFRVPEGYYEPLELSEGENIMIEVRLTEKPTEDLTVTFAPKEGNSHTLTVTPLTLTFTTADAGDGSWMEYQSFTVAAVDDDVTRFSGRSEYVTLTAKKSDETTVIKPTDYEIIPYDNDYFFHDEHTDGNLNEGEELVYRFKLRKQPTGVVKVKLSFVDPDFKSADFVEIATNPPTDPPILTFNNQSDGNEGSWENYQDITVSYPENNTKDIQDIYIEYGYPHYLKIDISVTETGDDSIERTSEIAIYDLNLYLTDNDDGSSSDLEFEFETSPPQTLEEGSSETIKVKLTEEPPENLTVALAPSADNNYSLTVDPPTLTFTTDGNGTTNSWADYQSFMVSVVDDDVNKPSADENYVTLSAAQTDNTVVIDSSYAFHVDDNDLEFVFDLESPTLVEGESSVTIKVKLSTEPFENLTVDLTPSADNNYSLTVDPPTLTFTTDGNGITNSWAEYQMFTVSVTDDEDIRPSGDPNYVTIVAKSSDNEAVATEEYTLFLIDNDAPKLVFDDETQRNLREGAEVEFQVKLSREPTADVTLDLVAEDQDQNSVNFLTFDPPSLTFNNQATTNSGSWADYQMVTVEYPNNESVEENKIHYLKVSPSGGGVSTSARYLNVLISDNDGAHLVIDPISQDLPEGTPKTFTVKLSEAPTATVTVSLTQASGNIPGLTVSLDREEPPVLPLPQGSGNTVSPISLTFEDVTRGEVNSWEDPQTITVEAPENPAIYNDGEQIIKLDASGGGVDPETRTVTFNFEDNDRPELQIAPDILAYSEGGDAVTFTIQLTKVPSGDVTVDIANKADNDVTLDISPAAPLTFTTMNWNKAQMVTVSATDNNSVDGNNRQTIEITATGGGVDTGTSKVLVDYNDDETPELEIDPTTLEYTEGGSDVSFEVKLTNEPTGPVTVNLANKSTNTVMLDISPAAPLTFTTMDWNEAQTVTVSATDNNRADGNGQQIIEIIATGGGVRAGTNAVTINYVDDDTPELEITPTRLDYTEGGSDVEFTVRLTKVPSATVTVDLTLPSTNTVTLDISPDPLTFMTSDWSAFQTVTVSAIDNSVPNGNAQQIIKLDASGGGVDTETKTVRVDYVDDETPTLEISPTVLSYSEGADPEEFTVKLTKPPSGTVTVSLVKRPDNPVDLNVKPTSLTFENVPSGQTNSWADVQTVQVNVPQNSAIEGNGTQVIDVSASGGGVDIEVIAVGIHYVDDDIPELEVTPTDLNYSEGATAEEFTVKLTKPPNGDVTVDLTNEADNTVTLDISPPQLTFRDVPAGKPNSWADVQTVRVSVQDNITIEGNGRQTIGVTPSGGGVNTTKSVVSVLYVDDDIPELEIDPQTREYSEGADPVEFNIKLTKPPDGTVTVTLTKGQDNAVELNVVPTSLTFENVDTGGSNSWADVQTVQVSTVDNSIIEGNGNQIINLVASGGKVDTGESTVTIDYIDDDIPELEIDPQTREYPEGADPVEFNIKLTKPPNGTVTVNLTERVGNTVDLTLSSAQLTFEDEPSGEPNSWADAQIVQVSAPDNNSIEGNVRQIIEVTASGGGVDEGTSSISVDYLDDDIPRLDIAPTPLQFQEGRQSTVSFTVRLTKVPSGDVTVNLTERAGNNIDFDVSPTQLIFKNGDSGTDKSWADPQTVTLSKPDDNDINGSSQQYIDLVASGGDAHTGQNAVLVNYFDDDIPVMKISPTFLRYTEGEDPVEFSVWLTKPPNAPVTVNLVKPTSNTIALVLGSSQLTFENVSSGQTNSWEDPQTVMVSAVNNAIIDGNAQQLIELTASNGGVDTRTNTVKIEYKDDETPELEISKNSHELVEGGEDPVKFSVWLTAAPSGTVTVTLTESQDNSVALNLSATSLTFTTSDWMSPQTVTVSATDNGSRDGNASQIIVLAASGGSAETGTKKVTIDYIDDETPVLVFDETIHTLDEGGTLTFSTWLTAVPTGNVTVNLALLSTNSAKDLIVNPPSLTFTTSDWMRPQTVTVHAPDNSKWEDNLRQRIDISPSLGGVDTETKRVSIDYVDDETTAIGFSTTHLSYSEEGDPVEFSIRLTTAPPGGTVTVNLANEEDNNIDLIISPSSLTFTTSDWEDPQAVMVSALSNNNWNDNLRQSIDVSASGSGVETRSRRLTVGYVDDETPALEIYPTNLGYSEGGDPAEFSVRLTTAAPSGDVTVSLTNEEDNNIDLTISPASLTFTTADWMDFQTVMVSVQDNNTMDGDLAQVIEVSASGGQAETGVKRVTVNYVDDETPKIELAPQVLNYLEGGDPGEFTVRLTAVPNGRVTVDLENDADNNINLNVNPSELTFENVAAGLMNSWADPQTVTVSVPDNNDIDGNRTQTVKLTASGGGANPDEERMTIYYVDDDLPELEIDKDKHKIVEGGDPVEFTIRLTKIPTGRVTVDLTERLSNTVSLGLSSFQLTFENGASGTANSWEDPQTVTVSAPDNGNRDGNDRQTIEITASGGGADTEVVTVSIDYVDDETPGLQISPASIEYLEGADPAEFTVRLTTVPSGDVTVNLAKRQGNTIDLDLSLTQLTFKNGASGTDKSWEDPQTVMVSKQDNNTIDGNEIQTIELTASGGGVDTGIKLMTVNYVDDETPKLEIAPTTLNYLEGGDPSEFTVRLTTAPTGNVTVNLTGRNDNTIALAISPSQLTFANVASGQTNSWEDPQMVTVSAVDNAIIDGNETQIVDLDTSGGDVDTITRSVAVNYIDDETPALEINPTRLIYSEGGDPVEFTVRLDKEPTGTVTVDLTKREGNNIALNVIPAQLIFENVPSGQQNSWADLKTVTVSASDNNSIDDNKAQYIDLNVSGGDADTKKKSVTIDYIDDELPKLEIDDTIHDLVEGGDPAEFFVWLTNPPNGTVTVNLVKGGDNIVDLDVSPASLIFENVPSGQQNSWADRQAIMVSASDNGNIDGNIRQFIGISASGGGVDTRERLLSFDYIDDETPALEIAPKDLEYSEGGTPSEFTVRLSNAPTGTVTVILTERQDNNIDFTLSSTQLTFENVVSGQLNSWADWQTVTVSAQDNSKIDGNEAQFIDLTASGGDVDTKKKTLAIAYTDDDLPKLEINDTTHKIAEGGTPVEFTVRLTNVPDGTVTVNLVKDGDNNIDLNVSPDLLTFTTAPSGQTNSWADWQTVTVSAADNSKIDGNDRQNINVTASGGGADTRTVAVSIDYEDDETPDLIIDPSSLIYSEGGDPGRFTIRLDKAPTGPVTLNLTQRQSNTINLNVIPLQLTFENVPSGQQNSWADVQFVTVTAPDNNKIDGNEAQVIRIDASGGDVDTGTKSMTIYYVDDETPELEINRASLNYLEGGAPVEFTVRLNQAPTGTVTVNLIKRSENTINLTVSPIKLTFENVPSGQTNSWADWQTVTVSAQDNSRIDGSESQTIELVPSGGGVATGKKFVTINYEDDEGFKLETDKTSLDYLEGGDPVEFTVRLTKVPSGDVTVNLTKRSDNSVNLDVSPTSLTFTTAPSGQTNSWADWQTVMVSAPDNNRIDGNDRQIIVLTASSGGTSTVSIDYIDDETPELEITPKSLDYFEGGDPVEFAVQLTKKPNGAVTVNLTNSQDNTVDLTVSPASLTFEITNWNNPQTVRLSAQNNNDIDGNDTQIIELTPLGGGIHTRTRSVVISYKDDETPQLELDNTLLSLAEQGDPVEFAIRLTKVPDGDVTVNLANDEDNNIDLMMSPVSLTFTTSNWADWQTVAVSAQDNSAIDGNTQQIIDITASGGGIDSHSDQVTINYLDDETPQIEFNESLHDLAEKGDPVEFTVRLTKMPNGDVTVNLTNDEDNNVELIVSPASLTFTTSNWEDPQRVMVSVPDNNKIDGNRFQIINATASGGGADTKEKSVTINYKDDDVPELQFSETLHKIFEGGAQVEFTIRLTKVPSGDVTVNLTKDEENTVELIVSPASLTFTTSNWEDPQRVMVSASDNNKIDGNDRQFIDVAVSGGGADTRPQEVSIDYVDDETPELKIDKTLHKLVEGETPVVFTIRLTKVPNGDVTVNLTNDEDNTVELILIPTSLTFTTSDWENPKPVSVSVRNNNVIDGNARQIIEVTALGGGILSGAGENTVAVDYEDDETPQLEFDDTIHKLFEGGDPVELTVQLTKVPSGDVTVTLTNKEDNIVELITSPASLTFTDSNWNNPQTVKVSASDNNTIDGNKRNVINVIASGGGVDTIPRRLSFDYVDDETPQLDIKSKSILYSEGGFPAEFTVQLTSVPTGEVTVNLSNNEDNAIDMIMNPNLLIFTTLNWNDPQTVKVSAEDNNIIDDSIGQQEIDLSPLGGSVDTTPQKVSITYRDDEVPELEIGNTLNQLFEGGTPAVFTIRLTRVPSGEVTVTLTNDEDNNIDLMVSPVSLTFTTLNWADWQTVTVSAQDNSKIDGNNQQFIRVAASGGDVSTVVELVTINYSDDDIPEVEIDDTSHRFAEGGPSVIFSVWLTKVPNGPVTINLTNDQDNSIVMTVIPASLTFTTSNWKDPQSVSVSARDNDIIDGNDRQRIDLTVFGGGVDTRERLVVVDYVDDETPELVIYPTVEYFYEGGDATEFTIRLDKVPSGDVTVNLTNDDDNTVEMTVSPAQLTFKKGDSGTLRSWADPQTVKVSAPDNNTIDGNDRQILVLIPSGGGVSTRSGQITIDYVDDETPTLEFNTRVLEYSEGGEPAELTVQLTNMPSGDVTVEITKHKDNDVDLIVSPTLLTFTTSNWNESQTVKVSALDNDEIEGNNRQTLVLIPSGGEVDTRKRSVVVDYLDDDSFTLDISPTSLDYSEGGAPVEFTVRLTKEPSGEVQVDMTNGDDNNVEMIVRPAQLTFTTSDWNEQQTVTISVLDNDEIEGNYRNRIWVHASVDGLKIHSRSVSVDYKDNETPDLNFIGFDLGNRKFNLDEGSLVVFTVELSREPYGDVTVDLKKREDNNIDLTIDPTSLAFTIEDWSDPQVVYVSAQDNEIRDPSGWNYVDIFVSDEDETFLEEVILINYHDNDRDKEIFLVSAPDPFEFFEGESITFSVKLVSAPEKDLTVTTNTAGDLVADPNIVIFSSQNWNDERVVTLSAEIDDDDDHDHEQVELVLSGGGFFNEMKELSLRVRDLDAAGIVFTPSTPIVNEGLSTQIDMKLNTEPKGDVTVTIPTMDEMIPHPALLNFTAQNWNEAQTVTLTVSEDDDQDSDRFELRVTALGANYHRIVESLYMTIIDNDLSYISLTPDLTTPEEHQSTGMVYEGEAIEVEVVLGKKPTANVIVNIFSDSDFLAISPPTLTFTPSNWDVVQAIILTSSFDDNNNDEQVELTLEGLGGGYDDVIAKRTFTIRENTTVNTEDSGVPPLSVTLWGNYPNPFSELTNVIFDLPAPAEVSTLVTDILGRTVLSVPGELYETGRNHTMQIYSRGLSSGVYYYTMRVRMDHQVTVYTKPMIVVR